MKTQRIQSLLVGTLFAIPMATGCVNYDAGIALVFPIVREDKSWTLWRKLAELSEDCETSVKSQSAQTESKFLRYD